MRIREPNRRIMVVDDEHDLLKSYEDILTARQRLQSERAKGLFSRSVESEPEKEIGFEVVTADQGQLAVELAREALMEERPFAVAFLDMRMPPGWDGLETARALRKLDPRINIVIVTAFADKTIDELQASLKHDVLLLRKPFISEEIYQLAWSLGRSWDRDRELEQERAYYDCILTTMDEPLLILDFNAQIQDSNPAFSELIGMGRGELVGKTVDELFAESSVNHVLNQFQSHLQRMHDQNRALYLKTLEEAPIPLLLIDISAARKKNLILLSSEKFDQMLGYRKGALSGTSMDALLSEPSQLHMQKHLVQIEHQLECVEDADCYWIHRNENMIRSAICLLMIQSQESTHVIIQLSNDATMSPELLKMTQFGRLFERGEGKSDDEQLLLHRSGEEVPVSVSGSLFTVKGQQNERGAILVVHDLRDRKQAEAREQYAAFQSGVAEMSANILHNVGNSVQGVRDSFRGVLSHLDEFKKMQQLYSTLREQMRKNQEQGDLEATEQMNRIVIEASDKLPDAIEEALPDEALLQRVEMGIEHIFSVIRSQQSGARPETHQTHFSLAQLMDDLTILTQSDLEKQRVELTCDVPEGFPDPYLPRNQLLQALINLVKNGAESILSQIEWALQENQPKPEPGVVRVSATIADELVIIRVVDNGMGVDPEIKSKLFRFGFTTKSSGSGFGLHSIGNFVVSCGGKITVNSDGIGKGAMIEMRLPMNNTV
jgi:signal transduction histidine kinase/PAS domain-containing protein